MLPGPFVVKIGLPRTCFCVCKSKLGKPFDEILDFPMEINNVNFCDQVWHHIWSIYLTKYPILGSDILINFLIYPYKEKYMLIRKQPFLENAPAVVTRGVSTNFLIFTPKSIVALHILEQIPLTKVTNYCL